MGVSKISDLARQWWQPMSDFKDEPPTLKSDTPISRLQERIATAIWNEVECDEFTIGDAKSAADAVIRELHAAYILVPRFPDRIGR